MRLVHSFNELLAMGGNPCSSMSVFNNDVAIFNIWHYKDTRGFITRVGVQRERGHIYARMANGLAYIYDKIPTALADDLLRGLRGEYDDFVLGKWFNAKLKKYPNRKISGDYKRASTRRDTDGYQQGDAEAMTRIEAELPPGAENDDIAELMMEDWEEIM